MKPTCYIFGAGASAAEGLPGTSDLFPHAFRALGPDFDQPTRRVWHFLERVFGTPVRGPDSFNHLPPVDEVISLVDHCLEEGQGLGHGFGPARLLRVKLSLQHLLCAGLEAFVGRAPADGRAPDPHGPHALFARQLSQLGEPVGLISLNYDTLLDRAIMAAGCHLDYGFGRPDWQPGPATMLLAKLHGSLNWALCTACDRVEVVCTPIAHLLPGAGVACSGCGNPRLQEVIVAPALRKRYTSVQLKHVWALGFDMLRRAERIVFVGYSLPQADTPVLHLILRAMLVRGVRPAVEVINHTDNGLSPEAEKIRRREVAARFHRLFGPDIRIDFDGFRGQIKVRSFQTEGFRSSSLPMKGT